MMLTAKRSPGLRNAVSTNVHTRLTSCKIIVPTHRFLTLMVYLFIHDVINGVSGKDQVVNLTIHGAGVHVLQQSE